MKLDPSIMRTMGKPDFRVLTAVESGMQTGHYLVPSALISNIANLRHGGVQKHLSSLLRDKLLSHDQSCGYDGYRITNSGYDILALQNLKTRGMISAFGDQIGVGKESDVYLAVMPCGRQVVVKLHRLGRTSFRDVKKKRDYFMVNAASKNKKNGGSKSIPNSWLFLSRISALKEYAFMKALYGVDYPTPEPIAHNRHAVVMGLVRGVPLYQIHTNRVSADQAESIFRDSLGLAQRLASHGLVHCDLNEFNLMVDMSGIQKEISGQDDAAEHYVRHSGMSSTIEGALSAHNPLMAQSRDATGEIVTEETPKPKELLDDGEPKPIVTLIDFPQMVSTRHPNAKELFDRDAACLKKFFSAKMKCIPDVGWDEIMPQFEDLVNKNVLKEGSNDECLVTKAQLRLDEELQASGFSEQDSKRASQLHYYESTNIHANPDNTTTENNLDAQQPHSGPELNDIINDCNNLNINAQDEQSDRGSHDENEDDDDEEKDEKEYKERKKWEHAEDRAKLKVRRQVEDKKKAKGRQGAFRVKNTNKTYCKGKRIFNDTGY